MSEVTRVFVRSSEQPPRSAKYGEHFFRRVEKPAPAYEPDVAPLVPETKKIGRLAVGLADAERVAVARGTEGVRRYEATERPTLRFRGKLTVSPAEETAAEVEEEAVPPQSEAPEAVRGIRALLASREAAKNEVLPATASAGTEAEAEVGTPAEREASAEPTVLTVAHHKGRGPLHTYTKAERANREPLVNPDGIIGMQRARITDRNPRDATLKVAAPVVDTRTSVSPIAIVVAGVFGLMAAFLVSGLYTSVEVSDSGVAEAYGLTFKTLIESVRGQFTALIVHSFGR